MELTTFSGLAKAHGAKFLLASTSEIYGDPDINPQPETYWGHVNPVGPRSMYDEAKRFGQAIAVAYWGQHRVDVRIARIFNTYGPRMRLEDGRVLPNFISQALRDEPLSVYGDGSQTRSLCYVDDMVEGLYRLMVHQGPADGYQDTGPIIVNLGNPEEVTMLALAQDIIDVTGSKSQIAFSPLPPGDPRVRCPDIERAKTLLGWEPQVSRKEGLQRILPYFQTLH